MTDQAERPGLLRRAMPWMLAILIGVGVGWMVGGSSLFQPDQVERDTPVAPPPAVPERQAARPSDAARAIAGPPIALNISNRDCQWGPDFDAYYRQATAIMAQAGTNPGREMESVRVRVPARSWNGLTVTAIEAVHEGAGIIFAEPPAAVRAAFTRTGIQVADDGMMPFARDEDPGLAQSIQATSDSAVRYGATILACGA